MRTCLLEVESLLMLGGGSLKEPISRLRVKAIPTEAMRTYDPGLLSLFSVNTSKELSRARQLWEDRAPGDIGKACY